jgi:hypothetical protein
MNYNFTPISIEKFADIVAKNNKDQEKTNIIKQIKSTLKDLESGKLCDCGNPIWVAGSALAGNACFTCITGETEASKDFEIIEAM